MTFRDLPGLRATLDSLSELREAAGERLEVIVQDGGTEGFEEFIQDYPWAKAESASDGGIYFGMNKAIARSTGQFCWFLNGGDLCRIEDWPQVGRFLEQNPGAMCMFDYDLDLGGRTVRNRARDVRYLYHALPTSHQAIMYPGEAIRRQGYDTSYKIVGDYALTARLWREGTPTAVLHVPVAEFGTGGTSQQHAKKIAVEAGRAQREIVNSPLPLRMASQAVHLASRVRRDLVTRTK